MGGPAPPHPFPPLLPPLHFLPLPYPPLPFPPLPFPLPSSSFPFLPLPSLPFPLEVGPLVAAKGSGGALKLPQRVRAERGRQTCSGAF